LWRTFSGTVDLGSVGALSIGAQTASEAVALAPTQFTSLAARHDVLTTSARASVTHNAHENPFEMRPHGARGDPHGMLPKNVLRQRKTRKSQKNQFSSDSGPRN
jgi:hypothetical protein